MNKNVSLYTGRIREKTYAWFSRDVSRIYNPTNSSMRRISLLTYNLKYDTRIVVFNSGELAFVIERNK